jgi:hypothetical protein
MKTEDAFWNHVLPFHCVARILHLCRQELVMHQNADPRIREVPPAYGNVYQSALLSILRTSIGAKVAIKACCISLRDRTQSQGNAKYSNAIARRVCSVLARRIQVRIPSAVFV